MEDPLVFQDVYLREVQERDLHQLRAWRNEWAIRATTREYRLLTDLDQERWFESLAKRPPEHLMFVIVGRGGDMGHKDLGVCGLTYIDWKNRHTEASIYIGDPDKRGKGIGKKALRCLLQYAFWELGMHKVYAEIYDFNEASISLFEDCGFVLEGTLRDQLFRGGKWVDSHVCSVLEGDFNTQAGRAVESD